MAKPYVIVGKSIGKTPKVLMVLLMPLQRFVKLIVYAIIKARKVDKTPLNRATTRLLPKAL